MSHKIAAIRGMNDLLPERSAAWGEIESLFRQVANQYGYDEIRFPIVESADLFARCIGSVTDIVEKEMYVFEDRNGDKLALRPEGTAGCARAVIQHSLAYDGPKRLWYMGPMYRHERPQKGRYRQFYQFGIECFGFEGPDIDCEIIALSYRLWQALHIQSCVTLELNSLGTADARARYRDQLVAYFNDHAADLDEDSQKRLKINPLRILDTKAESMQSLIAGAPVMLDHLDDESADHFEGLKAQLTNLDIPFTINPRLVRGLDYYGKTVFEWTTDKLGSQGTICAGGRYDGLVEQLGGKPTKGLGFAAGIERVFELVRAQTNLYSTIRKDVYVVFFGEKASRYAPGLCERLRSALPDLAITLHAGGGSLKSQFKRANKSDTEFALVIGDDEVDKGVVTLKLMRETDRQIQLSENEIIEFLSSDLYERSLQDVKGWSQH